MNLRIIPKIDIKNQNLVKGIHLEGLRSLGNPRKFIELYYMSGADEIIYHDVVASLYERNTVSKLLKETSKNIFLPMTVGGGINSLKEVELSENRVDIYIDPLKPIKTETITRKELEKAACCDLAGYADIG